jgi:hypothetical protein
MEGNEFLAGMGGWSLFSSYLIEIEKMVSAEGIEPSTY